MAEKKLRFKARIQGKEAGVVAAIIPPVDVIEYFGTRGRGSDPRHDQRLCLPFFTHADGRLPHDARE